MSTNFTRNAFSFTENNLVTMGYIADTKTKRNFLQTYVISYIKM
jgi:hypothetical protein